MTTEEKAMTNAELGRAAIKAGAPDEGYIKDDAITTIANVLHAYGDEWGARIGDALAEDVFEQALRRYKEER
jgi:hypothetical protein